MIWMLMRIGKKPRRVHSRRNILQSPTPEPHCHRPLRHLCRLTSLRPKTWSPPHVMRQASHPLPRHSSLLLHSKRRLRLPLDLRR